MQLGVAALEHLTLAREQDIDTGEVSCCARLQDKDAVQQQGTAQRLQCTFTEPSLRSKTVVLTVMTPVSWPKSE